MNDNTDHGCSLLRQAAWKRNGMRKQIMMILLTAVLAGCSRYMPPGAAKSQAEQEGQTGCWLKQAKASFERMEEHLQSPVKDGLAEEREAEEGSACAERGASAEDGAAVREAGTAALQTLPKRLPVKVKGIYVSAYVAGTEAMMDTIIQRIDETELNAVVIDVKDDNGRVTFSMDSPLVQELGASVAYIPDVQGLMEKLREHHIYRIARIPAFRDPYLAEQMPDWCCKKADKTVFRDRNGLAWVDPYKKEVWDYLLEIARQAGKAGFDEIQFDYIRFCTEKGMDQVVFDPADVQGRSRQEVILEFADYVYEALSDEGLTVSADVFGAVIEGGEDARLVGQDYGGMAQILDHICPMIYPSHYGDGYFGIAHPDMQPYDTVLKALQGSRDVLQQAAGETGSEEEAGSTGEAGGEQAGAADGPGRRMATVRPWLQDFTASYLRHHIRYGPQQVREQIQAVYDSGYEEWILWNAGSSYHYDGLLQKTPR